MLLVLPRRQGRERKLIVQLANGVAAYGHPVATRTAEEVRHP